MTAGDILVESLIDWGVEVVFGLPGDGINGVFEALRKRQDRVRFIQVRHEESAAFMACGYAKFTGKLGVCIATSGPGGIHLLNVLYDAKLDGQPVLAITGLAGSDTATRTGPQPFLIFDLLIDVVKGRSVMAVNGSWQAMVRAVRNHGWPGIASMALSAVDVALWDLKARMLNLPLFQLLGPVCASIPVYGSGGFTSYSVEEHTRLDSRQAETALITTIAFPGK
jgi:glyoxylate carboligase